MLVKKYGQKKEHRWDRIYGDIFHEVFMKRGYKNFTIQQANVLNQPINIPINTTINISDPGAKEFGKKIEKEVDDLLNTTKVKNGSKMIHIQLKFIVKMDN